MTNIIQVQTLKSAFKSNKKLIKIGLKSLETPTYGSSLRTHNDYLLFSRLIDKYNPIDIGIQSVSLQDASEILIKKSETLMKYFGTDLNTKILSKRLLLIEPSFEYLKHNVQSEVKKLLKMNDLPKELKQILTTNDYYNQIKYLINTPEGKKKLTNIISWSMNTAMSYGADIPMSFCLEISGALSARWAIETNRISQAIAEAYNWGTNNFFNIDFKSLINKNMINDLLNYVRISNSDLTFLKFKNSNSIYNPDKMLERNNYFYLLDQLNKISTNQDDRLIQNTRHKGVILLNSDSLGYISLGYGGDVLCEPIDGIFNRDIRMHGGVEEKEYDPHKLWGKYLNPKDLMWWKYKAFLQYYNNNGKEFPCECPRCISVNPKDVMNSSNIWNTFRREHTILFRNNLIGELKQSIDSNNIKGALFDKTSHSNSLNIFRNYFK